MRKTILNLLIILCLLFVPSLKNYKISVKAIDNVTTWHVPGNFTRIQDAINSPLVSDGDIIYVHKGIYPENVVINRTISLIGENKSTTIVDCGGTGNVISISKANNVSVKGFTIRKSGTYDNGILVDHSMGSDISDNIIIENSQGIRLDYSSGNVICGNTISSNNDGISLYSSSDNIVSGNTISSNNYYGIYLASSGKNWISSNFISYNDLAGISLSLSSDNIVSGNTISSNNPYGISLYSSNNNTIYHNNFDNPEQVFGVYTNFWDYNGEGNHWSDYTGIDLFSGPYQNESGSDGIGDSPYTVDEINQDNCPLIGTFYDFEVILERETYYVTIISNSTIVGFRSEIGAETGNKIIRFNVTGEENSIGFSRVAIPTEFMEYPHIVLVDGTEIVPRLLNISDLTKFCLYFTYLNNNNTISVISSKTLYLYYELLAKYSELQQDFYDLNDTYYELLDNYAKLQTDLYGLNVTYYELSAKYLELEQSFYNLNVTYYELSAKYLVLEQGFYDLNKTYYELLDRHSELQESLNNLNNTYSGLLSDNLELQKQFFDLNKTHYSLLINHTNLQTDLYNLNNTYNSLSDAYAILLGNYSNLLESLDAMNASYQEHLFEFSEQMQNFRSLIYIFATITAIFIMTTIYLSKHAHVRLTTKTREFEAEK